MSESESNPQTTTTSPIPEEGAPRLNPDPCLAQPDTAKPPVEEVDKVLPPLTPSEFRRFNRLAEHMDMFHNHFREEWNLLYGACEKNKRPKDLSIRQFLNEGLQFVSHLTMHHGIEERHVFPVLAKRMPAFRKELELLTQHKQIHAGLDKFEAYLWECRGGEKELRLTELKEIMDTFGTVLWQHLSDEVEQLGAENMRKYWTADEVDRLIM